MVDAMTLDDAAYKKSKAELLAASRKPTPEKTLAERIAEEVAAFQAAGGRSAFDAVTAVAGTGTTTTPPPAKVVTNPVSALDMTEAQFQEAKRQIASGKMPTTATTTAA
jgi:hypothetical protein